MKDFLQLVAEDLRRRLGSDLSRVVVIFPNKRASLFFNEYLISSGESPIWSPRYMSVSEFFCSLTDKAVADPIDVVCRLYRHYAALTPDAMSVDAFYGWGEQLLSDFDDADKNMAPISRLFADIRDYAALEASDVLDADQMEQLRGLARGFGRNGHTAIQQRFKQLWQELAPIYYGLNAEIAAEGLAYEGHLFREVAERLAAGEVSLPGQIELVAFVGFNVVDRVERQLFRYLQERGKALFYWDYDKWYCDPATGHCNEAGHFMLQNLRDFPDALPPEADCHDNFMRHRDVRSIEYVSSPTESAQAQSVTGWLRQEGGLTPDNARRTAVVLCSETLLHAVLHTLPGDLPGVNITKGYPVKHTAAYSALLRFMDEADRLQEQAGGRPEGNHDFLFGLRTRLEDEARKYEEAPRQELMRILHAEACFQLYTAVTRLLSLVDAGSLDVSRHTLSRLLRQVAGTLSVPFHGEPAVGLQLMGVLETRCLDFDRVLMLSVNEGVLPRRTGNASFIPHPLRKLYGLTTADLRVSVYAYYFYRLLQRARRVRLTYNISAAGTSCGEMSRFMKALLIEAGEALRITHATLQSIPRQFAPPVPVVAQAQADGPLFTRLTPSALKDYLKCPLLFYYKKIRKLSAPQKDDALINANDLGTVFHAVAEELFEKDFDAGNRPLTPSRIDCFLREGGAATLRRKTLRHFAANRLAAHPIVVDAITHYLQKWLRYEADASRSAIGAWKELRLCGAEEECDITLQVPFAGSAVPFRIYGIIDRHDRLTLADGTSCERVIDYKTGKKRDRDNYSLDQFFTDSPYVPENPLQVFLYSLMLTRRTAGPVVPMLYYVPTLPSPDFTPLVKVDGEPVSNFRTIAADFEQRLIEMLSTLIDPARPFPPTAYPDHCTYCDFREMCGR